MVLGVYHSVAAHGYISLCDASSDSCDTCAWSCRRLLKQSFSRRSLFWLLNSIPEGGRVQTFAAPVVGFLAPMWNVAVGGRSMGTLVCDPISKMYSTFNIAACSSVMVHSFF